MRILPFLLTVLILALPRPGAEAKDGPIVILTSSRIDAYRTAESGARERLNRARTVTYTLDGDPNRIPHVGDQLSLISPKAVIAIGSLAVMALKAHPVDAPVIFCLVVDHTRALSLPRSWAISMHVPAEEAYQRIRQILTKRRIGIPYDPKRTGRLVGDLVAFFQNTSIQLVPIAVQSPVDLSPALFAARARFDALWVVPDASFLDTISVEYLLRYAAAEGLPLIGYSEGFTRSGALLSLVADYRDMGRQAAEVAERVAAGEEPPPIQHPRRVQTSLNLRIADRLGITVNPWLAALAERVYP